MECIFCHQLKKEQIIKESPSFILIFDIDPIQQGHLLLISKEHYETISEVPHFVLTELISLEREIITKIEDNFPEISVTVVQNNGHAMSPGTHFHVHLLPRYEGDAFWAHQKVVFHELDLDLLVECLHN